LKQPNSTLRLKILSLCLLLSVFSLSAQEYFPKNDGVKSKYTNYTAFTNAKIHITPSQSVENGTLLIRDGKVVNVGIGITIPKNTIIINLNGKSIYPSFIDVYSDFGVAIPTSKGKSFRQAPQYDSKRKGYYWNEHIRPETNAVDKFKYDNKKASALHKAGFGIVNTHHQDGIIRGTGLLIALNSNTTNADRFLDDTSAQYLSFAKSKASKQGYPTSLMGAIALLRQVYYDADWYEKGNVPTKDMSLEAMNRNKSLQQIFYANDKTNALRADRIGDLFGIQYTIVGKGNEYQLIDEIKNTNATFILPLNFPKAYDVENPFQADYVSLKDMRYWNQAPSNPSALAKSGIQFSFTTHHLKSLGDLNKNIQKAIEYGLDKTKALEALTTVPAQILGKSNQIGSLKKGMIANFLITSGDIFEAKTTLYENWVQGSKNVINDMNVKDISGDYDLSLAGTNYKLTISGKTSKVKIKVKKDTLNITSKIHYKDGWVGIILTEDGKTKRLNTKVSENSDNLIGEAILSNSKTSVWSAIKNVSGKKKDDENAGKEKEAPTVLPIAYPNVGYGFKEKPSQEAILFKNATVWTNEKDGILKNTDVLVNNGKIVKVGTNLSDRNAKIIDATGKHLTAGIIDEHSHIGAASINEAGHNSSAEVSIEDNIDSEDINLYRNLAGGVTTMQILHGSANPIGGRSAIIKLKWGETGDKMI